jgi:hypothetical protein
MLHQSRLGTDLLQGARIASVVRMSKTCRATAAPLHFRRSTAICPVPCRAGFLKCSVAKHDNLRKGLLRLGRNKAV